MSFWRRAVSARFVTFHRSVFSKRLPLRVHPSASHSGKYSLMPSMQIWLCKTAQNQSTWTNQRSGPINMANQRGPINTLNQSKSGDGRYHNSPSSVSSGHCHHTLPHAKGCTIICQSSIGHLNYTVAIVSSKRSSRRRGKGGLGFGSRKSGSFVFLVGRKSQNYLKLSARLILDTKKTTLYVFSSSFLFVAFMFLLQIRALVFLYFCVCF